MRQHCRHDSRVYDDLLGCKVSLEIDMFSNVEPVLQLLVRNALGLNATAIVSYCFTLLCAERHLGKDSPVLLDVRHFCACDDGRKK